MAVRADERNTWTMIWQLIVELSPGRFAFALRLALICALTAALAEIYQTPEIALTVYLAFFLNKPDRASSMVLTIAVMILLSVVICVLLLLAEPVLGSPGLRVLTMTTISFSMLFLASASKLKPLASTIALILAYALDVMGSVPLGEVATRALLYAWLFIGVPGLISTVVNLLVAPSPRSLVQKEIAKRLRAAAEHFMVDGGRVSPPLGGMGDAEIQSHLKLATIEKTSPEEDIAALKGASDCLVTVLAALQLMQSEPEAMPPEHVRRTIENKLLELASIFAAGGYPAEVEPVSLDDTCSNLATSAVAFLNTGLSHFGDLRPKQSSEKSEKKSGFFLPDAFTNPTHVQFALKVTGAAMLCYLLYSVLSWPGIHTALITCFIVSLGTTAESVEKLTLRIFGCLIGAGFGLLVMLRIVPWTTGIEHLIALVFAGAFLGAWIAAGDERIAYAGFQIAFAYFLCVIQGASPSFDMVVARDRVIGILIGNVVSYFIATRVWPVSVGPRIASSLQKVTADMKVISEAQDGWSRRRLAAETGSMLEQIESDIHLARYEPVWIRPRRTQLAAQLTAVDAAQMWVPPLLGIAELAPKEAAIQVTALASLDTLLSTRSATFQLAMSNLTKVEQDA